MNEEWRLIPGFADLYVSDTGKVWRPALQVTRRTSKTGLSAYVLPAKLLVLSRFSNGYLFVKYRGTGKALSVHRLVATAFLPNPTGLKTVNHKNGVRDDNRVENLEWMSQSENIRHAHQFPSRKRHVLTKKVICEGVLYESQLALAKHLDVNVGSVSSALRKKHKVKGRVVSYV